MRSGKGFFFFFKIEGIICMLMKIIHREEKNSVGDGGIIRCSAQVQGAVLIEEHLQFRLCSREVEYMDTETGKVSGCGSGNLWKFFPVCPIMS